MALSPETARAISTVGTTGACEGRKETGCFVLHVPASEVAAAVRIAPLEGGPLVPNVVFDPRSLVPDAQEHDLGIFALDAYGPPIRFIGPLRPPRAGR